MDNRINLGGTMNRVEKIGDAVHRIDKGGPLLHTYLSFLEEAGMPGVPRFLGLDEQGREILSYLPGKTQEGDKLIGHPCLQSDETICDAARFMRKLHDVSVGFLPYALAQGWNQPDYPQHEQETICHNDAASWNFVFIDDRPVGLFDFDTACPGSRRWDLTTTVFSLVPLLPFVYDPEKGVTVDYDPALHAAERKRRVKLFFDAYGMSCPPDFMDLVRLRMQDFCKDSEGFALAHYRKVVAHIREHGREWV